MKNLIVFLYEYFCSEKCRFFKALLLPVPGAVLVLCFFGKIPADVIKSFYSNILTILGILLGFSISFHAIILSSDSDEFKLAKEYYGERSGQKKALSLFQMEVANNIFAILFQTILILLNIVIPLFWCGSHFNAWFLAANVFGIVFILVLLLRSIVDSYLIVTSKKK